MRPCRASASESAHARPSLCHLSFRHLIHLSINSSINAICPSTLLPFNSSVHSSIYPFIYHHSIHLFSSQFLPIQPSIHPFIIVPIQLSSSPSLHLPIHPIHASRLNPPISLSLHPSTAQPQVKRFQPASYLVVRGRLLETGEYGYCKQMNE